MGNRLNLTHKSKEISVTIILTVFYLIEPPNLMDPPPPFLLESYLHSNRYTFIEASVSSLITSH